MEPSPQQGTSYKMTEDIIIRILLEIWFIKAIRLRSNEEMKGQTLSWKARVRVILVNTKKELSYVLPKSEHFWKQNLKSMNKNSW